MFIFVILLKSFCLFFSLFLFRARFCFILRFKLEYYIISLHYLVGTILLDCFSHRYLLIFNTVMISKGKMFGFFNALAGMYLFRNYCGFTYIGSCLSIYIYFLVVKSVMLCGKHYSQIKADENSRLFLVSSALYVLYNMWLSLSGAILCMIVMFLICWITALFTLILILALYLIIVYRKPDVNWGSTTQAHTYRSALEAAQTLNHVEEHVKNYQPQILVLTGLPSARPALLDFANLISKNISLLICGHVTKVKVPEVLRRSLYEKARQYLSVHKIKAFYTHVDEDEFDVGAKALLQCSGMGKLRPNLLMMGYKTNWTTSTKHELQMYFNVIHMVLDNYKAMCILRVKGGFDYSSVLADTDLTRTGVITPPESLSRNVSASQFSHGSSSSDSVTSMNTNVNSHRMSNGDGKNQTKIHPILPNPRVVSKKSKQELYKAKDGSELSKEVLNQITQFQKMSNKNTIDVWWLYDDGGLSLLLPYIISTRRNWSSCKLRVFALANKKEELEFEQRNIASLLAKFRIDYSDLIIITSITRRPHEETQEFYNNLVRPFLTKDSELAEAGPGDSFHIEESEVALLRDKTNRQLRLRELLLENSLDANLIVMTLPMPRKNVVSAPIYMSWLEAITRDMPSFLLVRGNQTSVLTFYS